jgi:hypothetical protein
MVWLQFDCEVRHERLIFQAYAMKQWDVLQSKYNYTINIKYPIHNKYRYTQTIHMVAKVFNVSGNRKQGIDAHWPNGSNIHGHALPLIQSNFNHLPSNVISVGPSDAFWVCPGPAWV